MRVAIVHDWLTGMRGGEKAVDAICKIFPQAEIFTLIYKKGSLNPNIENHPIHTSFIQKLPRAIEKYRNYLPLFPLAIESFNLEGFDLIISSSHCVAKGIKKPKNAYHFCYCYTPMRYAWIFFDQYFGNYSFLKKAVVKYAINYLKKWDLATLSRVDNFIAISETIRQRIRDIYKKESKVIYPPVNTEKFAFNPDIKREDFYLCVSALVPYKKIDIIIEAFNQLKDKRVIIIGTGNIEGELREKITSKNIKMLGWADENTLLEYYQKAAGFIFPAEEDFGIAPVEAQSTGLPVIAYGKAGNTETVLPINDPINLNRATGIFFYEQTADSLVKCILEFEKIKTEFNPIHIRENALKFSEEKFIENIKEFIQKHTKINAF